MPNCFSLTRKNNPQAGPVALTLVDEEMCDYLKEPVDPDNWCHDWYPTIGFGIAMGKTFAQLRERHMNESKQTRDSDYIPIMVKIIDWLDYHFTTDAWAER